MCPELILWDWNGTLLDDVDLCVDALNRLLAGFGYPQRYDHERYRAIFGFPIEEYYVRAGFDFTKHSFAELAEKYMEDYVPASAQLKALAKENGMTLNIDFSSRTEYNDDIEKDHVISTIPEKDSVLSDGDTVVLVVSLGKKTEQVDMPGLLGQTEDMARKMLTSKGLEVGSVQNEYSNDYPKGQVCFQSVNEGTKVDQGTAINLIISDGPDPNTQPIPTEVTKTVSFTLPDAGAVVNVDVYDSQGNKVHSGTYDTNLEGGFQLDLKGTGKQVYTVYIDGAKAYDQTVDFDS